MVKVISDCPPPSPEALRNPERGFYSIFQFAATERTDGVGEQVASIYTPDGDDLLLVEIDLHAFAEGEISPQGLESVRRLFDGLRARGGSYILRFLYDWEGRGLSREPKTIGVILRHMEALGPVIRAYADMIYLLQGLFIGNWGEMHASRYTDPGSLRRLAAALRQAVGREMFLSVRTPAQWLDIAGGPRGAAPQAMGLYNDGIMGSETDLGSYRSSREEALAFQERLCRTAPNGGEAVDGRADTFEEAQSALRRMRVSYLNRHHDRRLLEKWRAHTVSDSGIWQGMDGLTYMERHLGYRFVLRGAKLRRLPFAETVDVRLDLQNVGFSPLYHEAAASVTLIGPGGPLIFPAACDLQAVPGGPEHRRVIRAEAKIPLSPLRRGEYEARFSLMSKKYQRSIYLGNRHLRDGGYSVGKVVIV